MFYMFSTSSDQWRFWYKHIWDSWSSGGEEARGASASRLGHVVLTNSLYQPWGGTEIHWVKNINARQEGSRRWQHTAWHKLSHILKIASVPLLFLFFFQLFASFFFFLSKMTFYQPRCSQQQRHHPCVFEGWNWTLSFGWSGSTFVNPCCLPSLEAIKENIFRMRQSEQINPFMQKHWKHCSHPGTEATLFWPVGLLPLIN